MKKKTPLPVVAFDVKALPIADEATAAAIKLKLGIGAIVHGAKLDAAKAATKAAAAKTKPGTERWPVKTGADMDVAQVQHVIVKATVEELGLVPRPNDMKVVTKLYPAFQNHRSKPTETTVWQVEGEIMAIKLEDDGDYHLVLQGASGRFLIGEIPTPDPPFVKATSPFKDNIREVRAAIDKKFFKTLKAAQFMAMADVQVPVASFSTLPKSVKPLKFGQSIHSVTAEGSVAFATKVKPTKARLTGVGFFDKVHGQTGVAPNGIELHPVLSIAFL